MALIKMKYAKLPFEFVHPEGLFCTLKKGDRKRLALDVTYSPELKPKPDDITSPEKLTYRFLGPEPLDSTDLRVLQGLVAYATANYQQATKQLLRDGRAMRPTLELVGDAVGERTIAVRFNLTRFIESIGYAKGGTPRKLVTDSITRLNAVTVIVTQLDFKSSFRVVSEYSRDTETGDMIVGLNPMLTNSVLSKKYLSVNIAEAKGLKGGVAHLLHWRLHWINEGFSGRVGFEKLCKYVYPSSTTLVPSGTTRRRQFTVRKALNELSSIGWVVTEVREGVYMFIRPKHK